MAEVAAAAGVAQATLYRWFPTRGGLLQALTTYAVDAAVTQLAQADLDTVPVPEGIARLVRLVAAAGSKYAAVIGPMGPRRPAPRNSRSGP